MKHLTKGVKRMKASLKISQIESKISDLQSQRKRLLVDRQNEIASLIAALDFTSLEDKVLIGGLRFLKHKISTKDPLVEDWHIVGERFLQHTKRCKRIHSSKKDSYPESTSQPSQKSSQSREKKNEVPKTI